MRINRLALLTIVPFALAACDPDETREMAESIDQEAAEVDAGQSMVLDTLDVDAAGGDGMQATVAMNEISGSGVSGDAMVAPGDAAGQSRVTVNLTAAGDAGGVHQGHIHQGTCDSPGSVVVPLPPVTIAGGTGTATSTVAVDAMDVMDGSHIVVYHEAGGNPGAPVVCGAIPGHVM